MDARRAMTTLLVVGVSTTFSTAFAATAVTRVVPNNKGMPRCLMLDDGNALALNWNKDEYQRTIYAVLIPHPKQDDPCASVKVDPKGKGTSVKWDALSSTLSEAALPSGVRDALSQVAQGGNFFRPEATPQGYLVDHPVSDFTREVNRELTAQYGAGFASEIYRSILSQRPEYQTFESHLTDHLKNPSTQKLGERAGGVTVMIANGFMQAPGNNRLKPMADKLRAEGLKVVVFKMDPVGALETNTELLKKQIADEAQTGRKLILIGGSKGVPELLEAIAQLNEEQPQAASQIQSVVNLSGVINGSFLIDWGMKMPQKIFVEHTMKKQAEKLGLKMTTTQGLKAMGTSVVSKYAPHALVRLPHGATYFNVLGVPGGNGLVREPNIALLQNKVSRVRVGLHGANDGYIEFPGTEIPNTLGLNVYTITFNSSHALLDGWYKTYDLQKPDDSDKVVTALFHSILDLAH